LGLILTAQGRASLGEREMQEIKMGDPVIMWDAKGMVKHGMFFGCKGTANSITVVEEEEYILFHPEGMEKFFWCTAGRFILDMARVKIEKEEKDDENSV
jgi:hypothetical protein